MLPDTAHHNCTVGPAVTSAVFYWPASKHYGPTWVGGLPNLHVRTSLGDAAFSKVCAGNNFGCFFVKTLSSPMGFTRGRGIEHPRLRCQPGLHLAVARRRYLRHLSRYLRHPDRFSQAP
jgi:hypothetical protein